MSNSFLVLNKKITTKKEGCRRKASLFLVSGFISRYVLKYSHEKNRKIKRSIRCINIEKKRKGEGQKQQSHYPLSDETGYGCATIRLLNVDAPSLA